MGSADHHQQLPLACVKHVVPVVGDPCCGLEQGLSGEWRIIGTFSVIRIRNELVMEILEELPPAEADRSAEACQGHPSMALQMDQR